MLTRTKSRPAGEFCADCGATDPSWASINRGLLLCSECCSVHRSLGRHVSQIKSLRQGSWPPTLLTMIQTLNTQNVNNVWEHLLLEPTHSKHLKKKPQSKDPIHPNKWDFIQDKHVRMLYVLKPRRDEPLSELGRALHSAVRSGNLDITLRLIAQGADPNYYNSEKGTYCLHAACRAGQSSQAELLVAWGAIPSCQDYKGATPSDFARQSGHLELADRMLELCYEVTDRLTFFLTSKKPDHSSGIDFVPPDPSLSDPMTDLAKAARGKLQLLPNSLFEELVMDVYDEIDRQETEAVWQTSAIGLERNGVAFLPVNPALSAPRNQGRQKLARLSHCEMATLVRDVLLDAARREKIAALNPQLSESFNPVLSAPYLKKSSHMSDDEPLYDSVCSDDDYAALTPLDRSLHPPKQSQEKNAQTTQALSPSPQKKELSKSPLEKRRDFFNHMDEILSLRKQVQDKDFVINDLKKQLKDLQNIVDRLMKENSMLQSSTLNSIASTLLETSVDQESSTKNLSSLPERGKSVDYDYPNINREETNGFLKRPSSMYEPREGLRNNWQVKKHQLATLSGLDQNVASLTLNTSELENLTDNIKRTASYDRSSSINKRTSSLEQMNERRNSVMDGSRKSCSLERRSNRVKCEPTPEQVHAKAELVTRCIQELWSAAQEAKPRQKFPEFADRISTTVNSLVLLFPEDTPPTIRMLLESLLECGESARIACEETHALRHAAYTLARATKLLLTHYPI